MELSKKVLNMKDNTTDMRKEFIDGVNANRLSLYRLSKTLLRREQDIEDAISETILKAYSNYAKLRDKSKFKGWILKILVNECYGIIKKNKKYYLYGDFSNYDEEYKESKDEGLMYYVDKLDKDFRDVVVLFYYERMSLKEISQVLSIREGTVKSRLNRARKKLKVLIDKEEEI